MAIESILVFCVLLTSIGSSLMTTVTLWEIQLELKTLNLINDKTNERLDRLINVTTGSINNIIKTINKK